MSRRSLAIIATFGFFFPGLAGISQAGEGLEASKPIQPAWANQQLAQVDTELDTSGMDNELDESDTDTLLDDSDVDRQLDESDVDHKLDHSDVDHELDETDIDKD